MLCVVMRVHALFSIDESKNVMKAIGTTREDIWKITEKKFSGMSKACSVMTKSVFQKFIACVVYLCVFL